MPVWFCTFRKHQEHRSRSNGINARHDAAAHDHEPRAATQEIVVTPIQTIQTRAFPQPQSRSPM